MISQETHTSGPCDHGTRRLRPSHAFLQLFHLATKDFFKHTSEHGFLLDFPFSAFFSRVKFLRTKWKESTRRLETPSGAAMAFLNVFSSLPYLNRRKRFGSKLLGPQTATFLQKHKTFLNVFNHF